MKAAADKFDGLCAACIYKVLYKIPVSLSLKP